MIQRPYRESGRGNSAMDSVISQQYLIFGLSHFCLRGDCTHNALEGESHTPVTSAAYRALIKLWRPPMKLKFSRADSPRFANQTRPEQDRGERLVLRLSRMDLRKEKPEVRFTARKSKDNHVRN